MGVLFSKPLTLQDLNTALDTALTPIRDDIALLKDSLLAPDADQTAKDVTVGVYSTGVKSVICHGCLMLRGGDIFLVSAAHSIVDLTHEGTYSIKWSVHQQEGEEEQKDLFTKVAFDMIHIPKEYVLHGSKDVGIARVQGQLLLPDQTEWLQVSVGGGELAGKTVVGHGRVFLRGSVLSYPNENRIMIDTPSISGCSGCPLIDSNKNLAAFVHGGVKHRGGRVLHNHNNGGTDNVTGYLYADSLAGATFLPVSPDFYEILRIAEDIEDELASEPTSADAYTYHASAALKREAPDATTLNLSMEALCLKIWSGDGGEGDVGEADTITMGPHLELLSHGPTLLNMLNSRKRIA